MTFPLLDDSLKKVMPAVCPGGSDSAALDSTLKFLIFFGLELPKAVMVTVPEPWKRSTTLFVDLSHFGIFLSFWGNYSKVWAILTYRKIYMTN